MTQKLFIKKSFVLNYIYQLCDLFIAFVTPNQHGYCKKYMHSLATLLGTPC